jgi:hypothetical protein
MNYHQYRCRDHPGQVLPEGWVEIASWFCEEDSRAGEAAGVSSDGGVWGHVPARQRRCSVVGGCGMGGGCQRAQVECDRPRSGGRMLPFDT